MTNEMGLDRATFEFKNLVFFGTPSAWLSKTQVDTHNKSRSKLGSKSIIICQGTPKCSKQWFQIRLDWRCGLLISGLVEEEEEQIDTH